MNENIIFRKADLGDIEKILALYEDVRGGEFCVWDEGYPNRERAEEDISSGGLYVLSRGGEILASASVEPETEDDDLPEWRICDGTHREVARVAVASAHQGKGLAKQIMGLLSDALRAEGARSIHLLAGKKNAPAVRTYRALGFDFIGECRRYNADYYVCEKLL
jgi:ribosomal protein S18 acetylase RimI-like enzyme